MVKAGDFRRGNRRRVGIFKHPAFVVAESDAAGSGVDQVVRIDRDLAAASGAVDHELRNGITCGVAAQTFDDGDTLGEGRPEVG